jgi:hypothetical protein
VSSALPRWFSDRDIRGGRAIAILLKYGIDADPGDPWCQLCCMEMMAVRRRVDLGKREPLTAPWGVWVRLALMAGKGDPKPLSLSPEGEQIRDDLARRGDLR